MGRKELIKKLDSIDRKWQQLKFLIERGRKSKEEYIELFKRFKEEMQKLEEEVLSLQKKG